MIICYADSQPGDRLVERLKNSFGGSLVGRLDTRPRPGKLGAHMGSRSGGRTHGRGIRSILLLLFPASKYPNNPAISGIGVKDGVIAKSVPR